MEFNRTDVDQVLQYKSVGASTSSVTQSYQKLNSLSVDCFHISNKISTDFQNFSFVTVII